MPGWPPPLEPPLVLEGELSLRKLPERPGPMLWHYDDDRENQETAGSNQIVVKEQLVPCTGEDKPAKASKADGQPRENHRPSEESHLTDSQLRPGKAAPP